MAIEIKKPIELKKIAEAAFLRRVPMNKIEDPDFVQEDPENPVPVPMIDEYPTANDWLTAKIKMEVARWVSQGDDLLRQEAGEKLTKDIFI